MAKYRPLQTGTLRHRGTIQSFVETQSESGAVTRDPRPYGDRWMSLEPFSGFENAKGEAPQGESMLLVKMHYEPGIQRKWRILVNGRVLEINDVVDVEERHKVLELQCFEVVE